MPVKPERLARLARLRPGIPRVGTAVLVGALGLVAVLIPSLDDYGAYVLAVVIVQVVAILSLNLLMGYAGQVSLGQAAFVGIGAYSVHQFQQWGFGFPLDLVAAVLTTVALATLIGLPSLRIKGLQLAALTLAFGIAAERLLFARPWDDSSTGGVVVERPDLVPDDRAFLLVALVALVLVLALDAAIRRSRVGRAFYAVRDREATAAAWGIPVGTTKLLAYALSGLYAGIAGGLYAFLVERLTPTPFDIWRSLGYVSAVVIGGAGSVAGVVVAGAALAGLPEVFRSAAELTPLVGAALLTIVPVVRPEGMAWFLEWRPRLPRRRVTEAVVVERPSADAVVVPPAPRPVSLVVPLRTLLVAEDVAVRFGGLQVLERVSLEVRRGEVVGLIGPNGAGKTTFFNVVSGFVTPQAGIVRYRDRDLLSLPSAGRAGLGIGRTFQHAGLCPSRTVWENALIAQHTLAGYDVLSALVRAPHVGATERELGRRAHAALEAVELLDLAHEEVGSLPYGKQRLAEVAAVLASGPELLMLDEPAAGLGPDESTELGARLAELAPALGITVLIIEHHVPMVAELCSYIYVLAEGTVLAQGTAAEIQRHPAVLECYLGEPAEASRDLEKLRARG